jgi:hypothetical protein
MVQKCGSQLTYLGKLNADPTGDKALLTVTQTMFCKEDFSQIVNYEQTSHSGIERTY